MKRVILFICFVLPVLSGLAQGTGKLYGTVTDNKGNPIELVNVATLGFPYGTITGEKGSYELTVPAGREVFIRYSFVGYEQKELKVNLKNGERLEQDVSINLTVTDLPGLEIKDERIRTTNYIRLSPKEADFIPTISGGIEAMLTTLPGVSSTNELSSQYSVRGGNFDENLVYVNGIEIYRPFLIRAGQQEGLSFVYPKLVSSIIFSAGGFDSKYGDKMSSVLDINYKKPEKFGGSVEASILGAQAHVEGRALKRKFTYLAGVRYKTNQYLLKGLETEGDYKPNFLDAQGLFTYDLSKKLEISFLGHYSRNSYEMIPQTRETDFGTIQEAFRLRIFFEGQEVDRFETYTGAFTLNYKLNKDLNLKFITSGFRSRERETYDILGQYWLGLIENAPGGDQFGDVVAVQGVGTHLDHARNTLDAGVFNLQHRGSWQKNGNFFQWGVKYQHEIIGDVLSEWELIDSAGFSIPNPPSNIGGSTPSPGPFVIYNSTKSEIDLRSNRINAYAQNTWEFMLNEKTLSFTAGLRGSYWDLNDEFLVSPRATVSFDPEWRNDIVFRFSTGIYYQPPFYRELRNLQGEVNKDIKSQRSIHFVLGSDLVFYAWDRPFKFVAEAYYKKLDNLIPYVVDNVRIRYYGDNLAKGYATGLDFKLNGEFIQGIQSWAGLSFLKTEEDIFGDYYYDYFNESGEKIVPGITIDDSPVDSIKVEPGYLPRPADQRVNFSMFFQDYLPKNPTYRIYLKLIFGTGLPFGPPDSPKYKHVFRYPSYRRVDIGLTKQLIGGYSTFKSNNPLRHIENAYISLEVFNLLQIFNTVSYIWVSDVEGRQYAVPNYLTPRRVNLKLRIEF